MERILRAHIYLANVEGQWGLGSPSPDEPTGSPFLSPAWSLVARWSLESQQALRQNEVSESPWDLLLETGLLLEKFITIVERIKETEPL